MGIRGSRVSELERREIMAAARSGYGIKAIVRKSGRARNTVRRVLRENAA